MAVDTYSKLPSEKLEKIVQSVQHCIYYKMNTPSVGAQMS